eukprot:4743166-Alexandrium_andersonii.AAC.1
MVSGSRGAAGTGVMVPAHYRTPGRGRLRSFWQRMRIPHPLCLRLRATAEEGEVPRRSSLLLRTSLVARTPLTSYVAAASRRARCPN